MGDLLYALLDVLIQWTIAVDKAARCSLVTDYEALKLNRLQFLSVGGKLAGCVGLTDSTMKCSDYCRGLLVVSNVTRYWCCRNSEVPPLLLLTSSAFPVLTIRGSISIMFNPSLTSNIHFIWRKHSPRSASYRNVGSTAIGNAEALVLHFIQNMHMAIILCYNAQLSFKEQVNDLLLKVEYDYDLAVLGTLIILLRILYSEAIYLEGMKDDASKKCCVPQKCEIHKRKLVRTTIIP
ncbi:hypothetical protein EGR_07374 [Echinococcus granulosus]|uniref:Uncharacterized protein n=1 Tax=Echinococcus granulosus TaxID=6210 RepID=W6UB94_ECHGR|nr:hypothetical protein EGR_07374 [Echinococcus granulosus]EUB57806.1 hypothetical protein EGR_07374 [Echinococcus granulosus]